MKNNAYKLIEDLKIYPIGMVDKIKSWIKDKLNEKLSQKEWSALYEKEMITIAKKGDLFFRSKLFFNKEGVYFLYHQNTPKDVLDITDISLYQIKT